MDKPITIGLVIYAVVATIGVLGVLGALIYVLSIIADGFRR